MDRPTTLPKRKRPPFNPPRPRGAGVSKPASTSTTSKSKPESKSTSRTTTNQSTSSSSSASRRKSKARNNDNDSDEDDIRVSRTPSPSPPAASSPLVSQLSDDATRSPSPDYILAEITDPGPTDPREELDSSDPMIPSKLLMTLLHRHFQDDKTKIAKDAGRAVAKYVDIFVREALARAAYERRAGAEGNAGGGKDVRGRARAKVDSYLEVEDLEKLAPQMVLDF
ncbi:hypothetical protein AJ79_09653 [Helicocarpus griseus UAMH5409]|uniref:CENP-S associating centromere protein X domain-containing protein n=1 Tax=Helicocarpus griseus UAMH5409 TaxID=1447875 RepID=A0A2B7WID6_9EURO|nr:hypothetical protein AJ79_09653 [Helicocarpus griseus UAMH5409]